MRVDKLMASVPATCDPDSDLGTAIQLMRDRRCGVLPVVDGDRRVVGIVTDRDIALALGAADLRPSQLSVSSVMTAEPRMCRVDETAHGALCRMRAARVRRLPVVDERDRLVGVVSIDDIVPVAQNVRAGVDRVSFEQVMDAIQELSEQSTQPPVESRGS
jgi:CBS domain-containing protein